MDIGQLDNGYAITVLLHN